MGGGVLLVDCSTLYYSPIGHHLWPSFPRTDVPWAHLYYDFYDNALRSVPVMNDWLLTHFLTLNKITAAEFIAIIQVCGFEIVKKTIGMCYESRELFENIYREKVNMELVPHYDDLFTESIRVLVTKTNNLDGLKDSNNSNKISKILKNMAHAFRK